MILTVLMAWISIMVGALELLFLEMVRVGGQTGKYENDSLWCYVFLWCYSMEHGKPKKRTFKDACTVCMQC